jgi:hypothetical protein
MNSLKDIDDIGEKHLSGHYDAIIKLNNPKGFGFAA